MDETRPITGPVEGAENPITSDLTDPANVATAVQWLAQVTLDNDSNGVAHKLADSYGLTTILDGD